MKHEERKIKAIELMEKLDIYAWNLAQCYREEKRL